MGEMFHVDTILFNCGGSGAGGGGGGVNRRAPKIGSTKMFF